MFQYAAGLSISTLHNTGLRFDLEWFDKYFLHQGLELPRVFGLDLPRATAAETRKVLGWGSQPIIRRLVSRRRLAMLRPRNLIVEPHFHYWPNFLELPEDCYIDGFWQSERYFNKIHEKVRSAFSFPNLLDERNAALAQEMSGVQSVSLHVRRGDFSSVSSIREVHGVDLREYYKAAIREINSEMDEPHYYVFTDDPIWTQKNMNVAGKTRFVIHNRGDQSFKDMQLMMNCRYHIIANSTFSWWGAWLNPNREKIIVAPRRWFNKSGADTKDLYGRGWRVL